jgi:hypothetical protein
VAGRKRRRLTRNVADRVARKQPQDERCVGIFWLVGGILLIDKTPLSEAEPYGNCLTHPAGHVQVWKEYQREGKVPLEMEYEEQPRGRVLFDTVINRFSILADVCILKRKRLITKIMAELNLPTTTRAGADSHYRCSACLYGTSEEE